MAEFNNLALTARGKEALLAAQAGTTLTLTKIGMGSGSAVGSMTSALTNLVTPEVMMPITEKRIDLDSGFLSIVAKMTNEDITDGFYWRETGLFFKDEDGSDVLFAYACVVGDQYDYVPAYNDKRYVKHVRIASIITDIADITVEEKVGLLYVDILTFEEYKEYVEGKFADLSARPVNNNLLINSNFANPLRQRGRDTSIGYALDRWFSDGVQLYFERSKYTRVSAQNGSAELRQYVDIIVEELEGKTLTMSCKISGKVYTKTLTVPSDISNESYLDGRDLNTATCRMSMVYSKEKGYIAFVFELSVGDAIDLEWAKLEIGDTATPYGPRLFAEEFQLCQRYFQTSPLRDSVLYFQNAKDLSFHHRMPVKMRTNPTITLVGVTIQSNGVSQTGFEFTTSNSASNTFLFKATKDSHGLSNDTYITPTGVAYLDAEI